MRRPAINDGIEAGKLNLWTYDNYHASTYGYYLEALVTFGDVTGRDPRSLTESECSAFELGLSAALVAAGLPLMLTILGLMASAGTLYLGTQVLDQQPDPWTELDLFLGQ